MRRPNVVMIHCHDLGRFLGCYGVSTIRTPSLDRLAADGVRFDRAFCTAPQCSPSRASLFTGRYPHSNGVLGLTQKVFGWDLYPGERHIASLLGEVGYATDLLGVHHESRKAADDEVGLQLGFDRVRTGGRADVVADRAVEVLSAHAGASDSQFYLQIGFIEPHRVWPQMEGGTRLGFVGDYMMPDDTLGVTVPPYLDDDASTRAEIAELQGAVSYMDAAVGQVVDAVEQLGLAEDTIVVFTTDHGLALPRAKCTLYDPGLETALIVRAPGLGWSGGRVVDGLVSNIDVVPTMLEAVGVPVPETVQGRSLTGALVGDDAWFGREYVFGEFTFHSHYDPRRCVRTERYKLIVNFDSVPAYMGGVSQSWRPWSTPKVARDGQSGAQDATVELYDLHDDPLELTNLADDAEHADTLDSLRVRLCNWMHDTDDPLLAGPVPSPAYRRAREFIC